MANATVGCLPVTTADENASYCADLVAGIADAGVDAVFISPGSRNTPLTLAFVREPRIRDISIRDERSAGFVAVGYGKATGRPAAVVCTSGSAATHYFPSVVEANQSASPLIVLTADRPARLRGTGAPQTMNQINLFGSHVKSFTDLDVGTGNARSDGRVLATFASLHPAGPLHANIALDEPLIPIELPPVPQPANWESPMTEPGLRGALIDSLAGKKVMIVAGGRQQPGFRDALNAVATSLGAPILADPQCWVSGPNTVTSGDLLASSTDAFERAAPDVVLRIGPIPTSKPIWTWLENSGVEQILVNDSRLRDPLASAATVIESDPTAFLTANAPLDPQPAARGGTFLDTWLTMDAVAGEAVAEWLHGLAFPNEPEIARALIATVPPGSIVHLASSMPIRDVDTFAVPRSDISVLANRGVNGIDGTISSALGAALAGTPVTLLIGDVAALHDATALAEAARLDAPLRVVVVNNDGGGIFSFLPQARSDVIDAGIYERHWGTPHGLSLRRIAKSMGLAATRIDTLDDYAASLREPIAGPSLIELPTDRTDNVAHHESIREAVSAAI